VKEIDARLKKAQKIADKDRKMAYIMSLAQWIGADFQMEQIEKGRTIEPPQPPAQP